MLRHTFNSGILALIICALLSSCSTGMSKDECALANWRQIGFEDGSLGRNLNYIARHRKSCAKAGITPDFDAYKRGHTEGLKQWCNYDNGLRLGEAGGNYEGICPENEEASFLKGYDYGKRLFEARSRVASIRSSLDRAASEITNLEEERVDLGELIIKSDTSDTDRIKSVARITDIGDELTDLELHIVELEKELVRAERRLQQVRP